MKPISNQVVAVPLDDLHEDPTNPRQSEPARMALLRLSIQKLGFTMPIFATPEGMLLSGHQRMSVARGLGLSTIPVVYADIKPVDVKGANLAFNRVTNDFTIFDTGVSSSTRLDYDTIIEAAQALPDFVGEDWYALKAVETPLKGLGQDDAHRYEKKSAVMAENLLRLGIRIPLVMSESGRIVNGVHRMFNAKERGVESWPVVTIPDTLADIALMFLNYLSMDFNVDDEFATVLRYSAFRRPQNNRGAVPKAYRFWCNGERTLPDAESYSPAYWNRFRDVHGSILDFGAGLGKVAPFLTSKGIQCIDFEPYRINMEADKGKPCPELSRAEARRFLAEIADGRKFDSIFLASVLNSVPFPRDRMVVLSLVHALSHKDTVVYGTCRDISDFNYEYGGIRQANYFVFDSEPGVRIGDTMRNPKIQKFMTQEEADAMLSRLWLTRDYWPGGNIFYFRARAPKGLSVKVLRAAILHEFHSLPYADGSIMGLGDYAIECFNRRLGISMPKMTVDEKRKPDTLISGGLTKPANKT